jgi:hypothetical protein
MLHWNLDWKGQACELLEREDKLTKGEMEILKRDLGDDVTKDVCLSR